MHLKTPWTWLLDSSSPWRHLHPFNPIPYGLRLPPIPYMGGWGIWPPCPKIPENGRLRLKLSIYNEDGLKLQKNPKQFHMKSLVCLSSISHHRRFSGFVAISGIYIEISPTGFDKIVMIFHRYRYAVSVIWKLDPSTYEVNDVWYGRTIICSKYKLFYEVNI